MNLNEKLIETAKAGKTKTVKLLLEKGADIHAENDSALCYAAVNGHTETVKFLLEQGADIHAENDLALYWAASNGHTETAKLLISNYKTSELKEFLGKKEYPQDLLQKGIQTREAKLIQKIKKAEPEMEI